LHVVVNSEVVGLAPERVLNVGGPRMMISSGAKIMSVWILSFRYNKSGNNHHF
jgi:uncharacterized protein YodC (DUF2158 family)